MRSIEFGIRDVISCGGLELNTSINVQIREFHVVTLHKFIKMPRGKFTINIYRQRSKILKHFLIYYDYLEDTCGAVLRPRCDSTCPTTSC